MSFTTVEGGPWEYLPLLNECLKILLTIAIGILMGYANLFDADSFVPNAVKFVFYVALPALILKGLGLNIDFYDDANLWTFIGAFLILRAIALLVSIGVVLFQSRTGHKRGIGHVAVVWLALTWISTVILGVPISGAVFGDPRKGRTYGILAGVSSFIFQLPLQLFFLECHVLEKDYLKSKKQTIENGDPEEQALPRVEQDEEWTPNEADSGSQEIEEETGATPFEVAESAKDMELFKSITSNPQSDTMHESRHSTNEDAVHPLRMWLEFARRGDIWLRIFKQLLYNPVLWGITGGFVLTLSTVGPRFLDPKSDDYVPGFGWFNALCGWLGACVSPLSMFAMGVWFHDQGMKSFRIPLSAALLFMLSKLVIVPLIMVGLAKGLDLNDEAGRAAVLIAALPISLASFSLAKKYQIGETILSENVVLGTALVLPTVLVWNLVMDSVELFPIDN